MQGALISSVILACVCAGIVISQTEARSVKQKHIEYDDDDQDAASAVIPSPNQLFGYDEIQALGEIQRKSSDAQSSPSSLATATADGQLASATSSASEAVVRGAASPVPVYASQYVVPERFINEQQVSSHQPAPNDYAPSHVSSDSPQPTAEPAAPEAEAEDLSSAHGAAPKPRSKDLKVAESYDHGHHGHDGHDEHHHGHSKGHSKGHHGHSGHGWLDMGAYTGKKGAFGWHAEFPVGGKKHQGKHGYRK